MSASAVMRDPIQWALSIHAEWERAEAEDDEYREANVDAALDERGEQRG